MSITYFAAALRCPHCGTVSAADSSTGMSSKLLWERGEHVLRMGDRAEVEADDMAQAYRTLRMPAAQESARLLELWNCAHCFNRNWAEVTIDGVVVSIEPVALTRSALARAHFLTENVDEVYEQITGEPLYRMGVLRPDFADLLRTSLPE